MAGTSLLPRLHPVVALLFSLALTFWPGRALYPPQAQPARAAQAAGGIITGRVTSAKDGMPLANVQVMAIYQSVYVFDDITDASGDYAITVAEDSDYVLQFNPLNLDYFWEWYDNKQHSWEADPIAVRGGAVVRADAALVPVGRIAGRVNSYPGGPPLATVSVEVTDLSGRHVTSTTTDASGAYSTEALVDGNYAVKFSARRFVGQYYRNEPDLAHADVVTVISGTVTAGIDASLVPAPRKVHLATSPALPNIIMAVHEDFAAPMFSLDGGFTWQPVSTTPWAGVGTVPDIAIVPRSDPASPIRLTAAVSSDITNWRANADKIGYYRAAAPGESWARWLPPYSWCNTPDQYLTLLPLLDDPLGLYLERVCYYDDPVGGTSLRAYFLSLDGGVNWQELSAPYNGYLPSPSRVRDPHDPARWYVVEQRPTGDKPSFVGKRLVNGVESMWAEQPCPTSFLDMEASLLTPGTVFLRCDQGLYRSRDAGDHWQRLTQLAGQLLELDRGHPGRLLWVKSDMLYASADEGETWRLLYLWHGFPNALHLPFVASR